MELHGLPVFRDILDCGNSMGGFGRQLKPGRQFESFIAVRHPHRLTLREAAEKFALRDDVYFRVAILALLRGPNFAAKGVHHELQAVTNAEDGQPKLEDTGIGGRSIFVVDRPWSARKNNADRCVALDLGESSRARQNDGENILFPNAARDELGILRAEVEDNDGLVEQRRSESGW